MTKSERIAAIDIGSDTIHLLIGSVAGSGDGPLVKRIEQEGELLLLGGRVALSGRIGERATADLQKTLLRFVAIGRKRASRVVVGATEALRRAEDGPAIVERLSKASGVPVRVLSGDREASLDFAGVLHRLDRTGVQLIIDSGGASTELTLTEGRRRLASASLPVGAALIGATLRGDPPQTLSWALRARQIGVTLAAAPSGKPVRAWATGGSAHNLAGLERTRGKSGPQLLTMPALDKLATRLVSTPSKKLARTSGEDPRRVAILPPGLLIIASVLEHYGLDAVTVVPEGVREGMILAVSELGDDWWRDQPGRSSTPRRSPGDKPATRARSRPRAQTPQTGPATGDPGQSQSLAQAAEASGRPSAGRASGGARSPTRSAPRLRTATPPA
jgi:exopolyphosphatase/guanosine-5'-triphosphate,3'-diphosphate pyrophosphatase